MILSMPRQEQWQIRKNRSLLLKLSLAVQTSEIESIVPVALLSGSFEERLRKAYELGYDGVELMAADPRKLDVKRVRKQVESAGLGVSAIGSGAVYMTDKLTMLAADPETGRRALDRLNELVRFAANLEAPFVTIGGFRGRAAWIKEVNARPRLTEMLVKSADRALKEGVRLVIEPLNRYESDIINNASEALALLNETGNDNLGIVLDTYHMNIEEPSFLSCIRQVMSRKKLWHIHIGDSNRLPPGGGHIAFSEIVNVLKETGYEGYLSAELLPVPDADSAARLTIEYMSKLIS